MTQTREPTEPATSRLPAPEAPLLLEDVAQLADRTGDFSCAMMERLRLFVMGDERFGRTLPWLHSLAREAGLGDLDDRLYAGLLCFQEFNRLLAAPQWQHPAEILDPDGTLGISYQELINIATARARHAEEPALLHEIREKLERARAAEKAKWDCVDAFVEALLAVDAQDAERLLRRASRAYRFHRRSQIDEEARA